jgi:DNA-nicking Smr family endonuclease
MSRRTGKDAGNDGKDGLNPDDFRLWKEFTRDIEPLEEPDWQALEALVQETAVQHKPASPKTELVKETKANASATRAAASSTELDLRTELRLRRGQMPIEARLDLHGYRQEQAHLALNDFITSSYRRGCRCLLVITGKGKGSLLARDAAMEVQAGVLKQKLPQWLSMSPLSSIVLKVFPAIPRDGGSGAFYIYLRRQRERV